MGSACLLLMSSIALWKSASMFWRFWRSSSLICLFCACKLRASSCSFSASSPFACSSDWTACARACQAMNSPVAPIADIQQAAICAH